MWISFVVKAGCMHFITQVEYTDLIYCMYVDIVDQASVRTVHYSDIIYFSHSLKDPHVLQ